jgi:putative transposase
MKEKGLEIYAWCIMTSHVHLIIGSKAGNLDGIVGKMKSHTSMELKKAIKNNEIESRKEWMLWMMERAGKKNGNNKDFQFWQQHNHPIELFSPEVLNQKLNYIHNNPVEAGFVEYPEQYLYSSARDYCGQKGLLDGIIIL